MINFKKVKLLCMALVVFALTGCQSSQDLYPTKDVSVIIPFNVGGGIDVSARALFTEMDKRFDGVKFVPQNITGASGTIGATELYYADNDGYTLMAAGNGLNVSHVTNGFELTYDDYELVGQYVTSQLGLYVRSDAPYQTYEELIEAAKANPSGIKMGVLIGTMNHYGVLAIEDHSGVKFQHIVVGGDQSPQPELLSGRIDAYVVAVSQNTAYIDSGDFTCLGVFANERIPSIPDAPTFFELGIETDYQLSFGIWMPKGTPESAIDTISAAIKEVCEEPTFVDSMAVLGYAVNYLDADAYTQVMENSLNSILELSENIDTEGENQLDPYTGPYGFPMAIAGFIVVLGIVEIIRKLIQKEPFQIQFLSLFKGRSMVFLLAILVYALVYETMGFIMSTSLFMIGMIHYLKKSTKEEITKQSTIKLVICSILFTVACYLFFTLVAGIDMPVSMLGI